MPSPHPAPEPAPRPQDAPAPGSYRPIRYVGHLSGLQKLDRFRRTRIIGRRQVLTPAYNRDMADHTVCDVCGAATPPHAHYVVRIDVYADPSVPAMSTEDLDATDFDQKFADLLEQMKQFTAEDLQDDVHRRFEFKLCRPCQARFLVNPLGKPRERKTSNN